MRLSRAGEPIRIEPQVFDVLVHLIEARGRVVPKEEILDQVWGDRFVSESALTTRIKSARQAVGDDGNRQAVIRTVHGRGYEFVAQVEIVDAPGAEPSSPRAAGSSSLPAAVEELIGRDALRKELADALETARLVTLVGPGGVGKTSLAYEVARDVERRYGDGVVAVELLSVVDPDATIGALATALDVHTRQDGSLEDAVVELLRARQILLVLDNCEHLVEPIGEIVGRVLRSASGVSMLATSREPLAVPSEHVWPIEPLPFASDDESPIDVLLDVPAIALFAARAGAADPRFELTERNAPAVVEICRRLDGMPLAIELAAARTRAIDVTEIAQRLDERFRLLRGVRRGADPRHHTLQDAVRWSYDLLEPDEQQLFAELSVFAGPFDLDAAEEVCGLDGDLDVLDVLTRLTERSMLAVRRTADGTRYELLETLRVYARSRLDDVESVELLARHAGSALALARGVERGLGGPDEPGLVARASATFADLRAAQRHALHVGDLDTAFGLIGSIREYAMRTMRYEALTWADVALEADGASGHPARPLVVAVQSYGAWIRGEFARARALADEAAAADSTASDDVRGLAARVLGNVLYAEGEIDAGLSATSEQLAIAEASGDASRLAHACYMHAIANSIRDRDLSASLSARSGEAAAASGAPTDLAMALAATGFASDDADAALEAFDESDRVARSCGNRWVSTFSRTELYGLLVTRGEVREASTGLAEVTDTWFRAGEWSQQWHTLSRCVVALHELGDDETACRLVGSIEARTTFGAPPVMPVLRDRMLAARDDLRTRLGSDRYEELTAEGAALPIVEVVHRTRAALTS